MWISSSQKINSVSDVGDVMIIYTVGDKDLIEFQLYLEDIAVYLLWLCETMVVDSSQIRCLSCRLMSRLAASICPMDFITSNITAVL